MKHTETTNEYECKGISEAKTIKEQMIHDEELLEINLVWQEWIMEDMKSEAKEAKID